MNDYFISSAVGAVESARMMLDQKRRAKAQEFILTAMYFAAKVNNADMPADFSEKLKSVQEGKQRPTPQGYQR